MPKHHLTITNGDSAVARMVEAKIAGEILPWRDILHEGPVPPDLDLEALSAVRARFLAERGWMEATPLREAFHDRDALLRRHRDFRSIVLWFEHDLYDQLQLLQVLDFFAGQPRRDGLYLIQAAKYLGQETPRALKAHLHMVEPVQEAHLALAQAAWAAFRAPTPEAWAKLLLLNTRLLPFLKLAVLRLLEEWPAPGTGLSRTEWSILKLISVEIRTPRALYRAFSDQEDPFFMGDWSFYHTLDQLSAGDAPSISGLEGQRFFPGLSEAEREAYLNCEVSLTQLGARVLDGRADALRYRSVARCIGGCSLDGITTWRWDAVNHRLIAP